MGAVWRCRCTIEAQSSPVKSSASPQTQPRRLLGDILLVARGTVFGQLPFVLLSPLIARLYPASELGIYGLALAFVSVAAQIVGLRFELAALSAREPDDARALFLLSGLSILPLTCACTLVLVALKISHVGSYQVLSWWLVVATGATVAAAGTYSTLRCWLARRHRFAMVASSLTVQGCSRAGLAIALAYVGKTAPMLVLSELLGRLGAICMMLYHSGLLGALREVRIPMSALRERAARFWKYPVLLAPSALIDAAATALPVPVLASCYGLEGAGKFVLVQRLMILPAALIVGSVGDVFHVHAADVIRQRPAAVSGFLAKTAQRLLVFALVVYVPVAVVGPLAARWWFGNAWADAGPMMAALAPLCIAQTVVSPISRGLLFSGREERKLLADLACLILPVTTLYLASSGSMLFAIGWFSAASVVAFIIYYVVVVKSLSSGVPPLGPPSAVTL
jgi:O-antigen/teichoic acid export membrane protein